MDKLKALWGKVQPVLAKVYAWSPLACGIALGYCGHGPIKLVLEAAAKLAKAVL